MLRLTDTAGHADTQRVTERRSAGLATTTTAFTDGERHGAVWFYGLLGPDPLSLTQGGTWRSTDLFHCQQQIPASTEPEQIIEEIYARYAASDEANLPLSSEANLHAFFIDDLATKLVGFSGKAGRLVRIS